MINEPVVFDLLLIILDLLPHCTLLVCQPLKLALHNAHLVLKHPPTFDDVCRARVQNLIIQKFLLVFFLLGIFHLGVAVVAVWLLAVSIALVLLLVSLVALQVVEIFKSRHDGGWREGCRVTEGGWRELFGGWVKKAKGSCYCMSELHRLVSRVT